MEWISITKRHPTLGSRVLIGNDTEGWTDISILCDEFVGEKTPIKIWLFGSRMHPFERVTHWLEIPSLLKGQT